MPTGSINSINHIVSLVHQVPHNRILDIGCGYGKYGLLLREYLNEKPQIIDAVEAWQPYIDKFPWLQCIYNTVYNKDASNLTEEFLDNYDVVMINDVIEHIEKEKGIELINKIKGHVIICTPIDFFKQEFDGNPFEQHVSHWTQQDFVDRADVSYQIEGGLYVRLKPLNNEK